MGKTFFDGRPIFEVANREELKDAVAAYAGKVEAPYVVQLPDSLTEVRRAAFCADKTIGVVIMPDTIEKIGEMSFACCSSLTVIHIPNSVKKIGREAFSDCTSLTHINIPASVTEIGDIVGGRGHVFCGCASLSQIKVDASNKVYDSRGNCNAIIEKETNTLLYGCANTVIPNTVERIGDGAFMGNKILAEIEIPKSVKEFSEKVFEGCTGLEKVVIHDTFLGALKAFPDGTFSGCTSLSHIHIPYSIKKIDERAFYRCTSLHELFVPDSVVEIANEAFGGCTSLSEITIPDSVKTIGLSTFDNCTELKVIYCNTPELCKLLDSLYPDTTITAIPEKQITDRKIYEDFRQLGPIEED